MHGDSAGGRPQGHELVGVGDAGVEPEVAELAAIAGILALGNLTFGDEENDAQAVVSDPEMCSPAATLLGSSSEAMETALLKATLKVSASESYTIDLDPTEAALGGTRTAGHQQRVFDHLVARVNGSLGETLPGDAKDMKFIGLLDVFGFEIFELNSFERSASTLPTRSCRTSSCAP